MLYISRRLGTNKYCVMDTDDGVESTVTANELERYTIGMGLTIRGVNIGYTPSGSPFIKSVSEINGVAQVRRNAVKQNMLSGVNVVVRDGCIISILVDIQRLKGETVVRLSDFGHVCGADVFRNLPRSRSEAPSIIIVIDDSLQVPPAALEYIKYVHKNIRFDIREVQSERIWGCEFKEYEWHILNCRYIDSFVKVSERLIDSPVRYMSNVFRGYALLKKFDNKTVVPDLFSIVPDRDAVAKAVVDRFGQDFISMSHAILTVPNDVMYKMSPDYSYGDSAKKLRYLIWNYLRDCSGRYSGTWDSHGWEIEQLMLDDVVQGVDFSTLRIFHLYLELFEPTKVLCAAYTRFRQNLYKVMSALARHPELRKYFKDVLR